jgi:predicted Zn-dependent protease
MATSDAGHGTAAVAAAQGRSLENQLRFSRSNETEADRVGQDVMYSAGFDPDGMSTLFERLLAINRFGRQPPEFLLSHPLTESRVSGSRGRAGRYPRQQYSANLEYQIVRARVVGHYAPNKADLVLEYERLLEYSTSEFTRDTNRYALAIAYYENQQFSQASNTLAPLLEKDPNRISYAVTLAEILTEQNEPGQAINFLQRHLAINPGNNALTMAYVDALIESRAYTSASEAMERHSVSRPNDFQLWYKLAETQGQAGNISAVHQARAEYFRLLGDYQRARQQLRSALKIESDNGIAPAEEARLRQKIQEIEKLQQNV